MAWHPEMVWEALPCPKGIPPRLGHTATLVGEKMLYIMGGRKGDVFMNDVWTFDCESEEWVCLTQRAPFTPRAYHTATLVKGRYIWVVGGSNQFNLFSDVHVIDTRNATWSIPAVQGSPMEIAAHGAVPHPLLPDAILLFGGYTCVAEEVNDFTNSLFVLHTSPPRHEKLSPKGSLPPKLGYHTFTLLGTRAFSFGGKDQRGRLKDRPLSVYDVAANEWLEVHAKGLGPVLRSGHAATAVGADSVLVYGGRNGTQRLADLNVLQVIPSQTPRKCTVQWHALPGGPFYPSDSHPGARGASTLVARKRSVYVFGGYGGDRHTYAHPYVMRFLPAFDSPDDPIRPVLPVRRGSPTLLKRTPPKRGEPEVEGWRSSKRARIREAVLAAVAPGGSVVGDSQEGGPEEGQTSPLKRCAQADVARDAETRAGRKRGTGDVPVGNGAKKRRVREDGGACGGVNLAVNGGGGRTRGRRKSGPPESSGSGQEEESPVRADVTETQSAADRGGNAGVSGRGWQAPHGKQPGGKNENTQNGGEEDARGAGGAEAFAFPCDSSDDDRGEGRRTRRKGGDRGGAKTPPTESAKAPGKAPLPVGKSTGLADYEREHFAAAVTRLEREKEALEGLLQDKVAAVAQLTAERRGLVGEKDGLAQQVVQAEQRWAAARDEALRGKQERAALQRELEEAKRLAAQSERQRSTAEAAIRTASAKLEETSGRLSETSLRREALESTAKRLEEELEKEQERSAEARQSHERERNTLNQVAHERAAEKEALRMKLEATGSRNEQLQETVSTLTRELADSRAAADDARKQGESHRAALSQARTEIAQLAAAKDAAEKTCASLSAEIGRLRAHSEKIEAEEGRLRTALVQAQGHNETLQGDLRRAHSDAVRYKDEAERLTADVRENQETAQKVETEARQLAEHVAQIRQLASRQLRLRPGNASLGRMSEHT